MLYGQTSAEASMSKSARRRSYRSPKREVYLIPVSKPDSEYFGLLFAVDLSREAPNKRS